MTARQFEPIKQTKVKRENITWSDLQSLPNVYFIVVHSLLCLKWHNRALVNTPGGFRIQKAFCLCAKITALVILLNLI